MSASPAGPAGRGGTPLAISGADYAMSFCAGRTSNQLPFIRSGEGPRSAALLFGASALFEPLDRSRQRERYARIAERLLPEYRILILGYHEAPPAPYTLDVVARDIATAIDETTGTPDLLLGLSFGGFVALRLAASRPDLVPGLVLLSSAHRFSEAGWAKVARQREALEAGDVASLVHENALLFRRPWLNWAVRTRLAWEGRRRIAARLNSPESLARGYHDLFGDSFADNAAAARRVRAPALVIGGTADQYFDADAFVETAGLMPAGQHALFEAETHMLVLERLSGVAAAIKRFVASRLGR